MFLSVCVYVYSVLIHTHTLIAVMRKIMPSGKFSSTYDHNSIKTEVIANLFPQCKSTTLLTLVSQRKNISTCVSLDFFFNVDQIIEGVSFSVTLCLCVCLLMNNSNHRKKPSALSKPAPIQFLFILDGKISILGLRR